MPSRDAAVRALRPAAPAGGYAFAVVASGSAVVAATLAERWFGLGDLSLVFMLAVLVVASKTSTGPAVATAVLCFLAYNFFFIEPRYTLYISARHGMATVALFLAAALLSGRLASRLAMQVQELQVAHRHVRARQALGQRLVVAATQGEVLEAARQVFRETLEAEVWVRLDDPDPDAGGIEPASHGTLRRNADNRPEETIEEFGWWFLPLPAPSGTLGVIGIKRFSRDGRLDEPQRQLARVMADDIAQGLLRTRLVADLESERIANESERLRNALLSSVSHDLRSPLAAIIGAAESLQSYGDSLDAEDRESLLDTVREEGQRLDRYIQNLLDMTRLGHGSPALLRDWIGVDELLGSAIGRLQRYRMDVRCEVEVAAGIGPIWVHPALVEQALFNVIENAARFSPAGAPIAIDARHEGSGCLRVDITDRGPGIPEAERLRIFDMFYSVERGDRGGRGTGLGLAICRGMIRAHGGDVVALQAKGGGTTIRISLPLLAPVGGTP